MLIVKIFVVLWCVISWIRGAALAVDSWKETKDRVPPRQRWFALLLLLIVVLITPLLSLVNAIVKVIR